MTSAGPRLALVLDGGGARAAYQVGLLRVLARYFPRPRISIITGVSAGAINAAYLANHPGSFAEAVGDLTELWRRLTTDQVFRVDAPSLALNVAGWGAELFSAGRVRSARAQGMVSTAPLRELLVRVLSPDADGRLAGVSRNLEQGKLDAVALMTINYATSETVSWVQGHDLKTWERPNRRAVRSDLYLDHVMASAALPLFFPAVCIDGCWYGDGGVSQAAPLAPAIHLGADRIVAVSTRYVGSSPEPTPRAASPYPPPAQILGVLFDAIFLDSLDYDAHLVERTNRLLSAVPGAESGGLRPIDLFVLRPSADLGAIAVVREPALPRAFRFLTRGLGTRAAESPGALSMLMFEPAYLAELIRLGEQDAQKHIARLLAIAA